MIGVEGQYVFKFKLGDRDDFIQEEELIRFTIIEEVGNVLPTFELAFSTLDEDILAELNEGNDIEVSFGKEPTDMIDVRLIVTRMDPVRSGDQKRIFAVVGMMSAVAYLNNDKIFISDKKSGVEVVKEIASQHFDTGSTFNVGKSQDIQHWVQANISNRAFINQCWIHSDIPNSFIACGISTDNKFILKDIKKDLSQPFRWRFISEIEKDNDISYDGDFGIDMNGGFINNWLGYKREKLIYNLEDGTEEFISEELKPVVALAKELTRRADVEKRAATAGIKNENVHPNFWQAHLRNLSNLAVFGSVKLVVSFHNRFEKIRILDQVMFKEDSLSNVKTASSSYLSGIYYVSKVARTVEHRQFVTTCEILRESLNEQKGSFATEPVPPAPEPVPSEKDTLLEELQKLFPTKFGPGGLL